MQLQGLTRIIRCFKPAECDFIRDYYLKKNNGSATKRLQLFDLLNNRLVKDNEQVSRLLYNRKPDSGFSQLKKRLKEDLLDFLVFFPSNKVDQHDRSAVELECRRLFVQAKTLVYKGIPDEAISILKKVQKLSREHDIAEMKALALDLLQEISDQSFNEFKADSARVERNFEVHLMTTRARKLYQRLVKEGSEVVFGPEEASLLSALSSLCSVDCSPGLAYWYHLLSMKRAVLAKTTTRAYRLGLKLEQIIDGPDSCLSKDQQLDFFLEMAHILYVAGKYTRAGLFARKAEMLCDKHCTDLLRVLEIRFVLSFCKKAYDQCDALLSEALGHPDLRNDETITHKWYFFEACMRFVSRDFKVSQLLLGKSAHLARSKSDFFIEHRLLELLVLIELEDHDLLEYRVESFRKLVEYHKDKCSDRVQYIMRWLRCFVRTGFDLEQTCEIESESLEYLMTPVNELKGLIDVQAWLSLKLKAEDLRLVG